MSLSKILYLHLKVLAQPGKTGNHPDMTEKVLLGLLHKASILVQTGPYEDHSAKFCQDPENFFMFSLYKPMQNIEPKFLAQGHNLNKLCRGPLDDSTYQISRLGLVILKLNI